MLSLSASTAASEQFKLGWHSGKGKSTGSDHCASSVGICSAGFAAWWKGGVCAKMGGRREQKDLTENVTKMMIPC